MKISFSISRVPIIKLGLCHSDNCTNTSEYAQTGVGGVEFEMKSFFLGFASFRKNIRTFVSVLQICDK